MDYHEKRRREQQIEAAKIAETEAVKAAGDRTKIWKEAVGLCATWDDVWGLFDEMQRVYGWTLDENCESDDICELLTAGWVNAMDMIDEGTIEDGDDDTAFEMAMAPVWNYYPDLSNSPHPSR